MKSEKLSPLFLWVNPGHAEMKGKIPVGSMGLSSFNPHVPGTDSVAFFSRRIVQNTEGPRHQACRASRGRGRGAEAGCSAAQLHRIVPQQVVRVLGGNCWAQTKIFTGCKLSGLAKCSPGTGHCCVLLCCLFPWSSSASLSA